MKRSLLLLLPLALACSGSSDDAAEPSAGGEAASVQPSAPRPLPPNLPTAMESGVGELARLGNGARVMAAKAIQEQCDDCWAPEVQLLHEDLEPADLQPSGLTGTLGELTAALEPIRHQSPFGALADALENQRQGLLARQEAMEPSELLTQVTAALGPIRAAIRAEAALAPREPALCGAALRLATGQLNLWEVELMRAAGAAERARDEAEGMRIVGILNLSRKHFEDLSIAVETGPETAVPTIRAKLIFFRSFDSVFDRGDDEALLEATATLCEPLATPPE